MKEMDKTEGAEPPCQCVTIERTWHTRASLKHIRCDCSTVVIIANKEGPYQDRPLLCPFRLLPLLTCS